MQSLRALKRLGHVDAVDLDPHDEVDDDREQDNEQDRVQIAYRDDLALECDHIHLDLIDNESVQCDTERNADYITHKHKDEILPEEIRARLRL